MISLHNIDVFMVTGLPKNIKTVYKNEDVEKYGFVIGNKKIRGAFLRIWPTLLHHFGLTKPPNRL
jgi:hypothetical protein